MRKKVIEVHTTSQPWNFSAELECGHWIDYRSYELKHYKTMNCTECDKKKGLKGDKA